MAGTRLIYKISCGSRIFLVAISSPVCYQTAAHGSAPDLNPAGDLGFADAGVINLLYLVGVKGRRDRSYIRATASKRDD